MKDHWAVVTWAAAMATMLALSMLTTQVSADVPHIVSATSKIHNVVSQNITAEMLVITVTFDRTVKISGTSTSEPGTPGSLSDRTVTRDQYGRIVRSIPNTVYASSVAQLKCNLADTTVTTFPAITESDVINGVITGFMLLHPTAEPALGFHALRGGLTFPGLTWYKDRLSFGLLLNGTNNLVAFSSGLSKDVAKTDGRCWIDVSSANTKSILDLSTGTPLADTKIWFNYTDHRCTPQGVKRLRDALDYKDEFWRNATTHEQFYQGLVSSYAGLSFEAYMGCAKQLQSMYTTQKVYTQYDETRVCLFKPGSSEWTADVHCNPLLYYSKYALPEYATNTTFDGVKVFTLPSGVSSDKEETLVRMANAFVDQRRNTILGNDDADLNQLVKEAALNRFWSDYQMLDATAFDKCANQLDQLDHSRSCSQPTDCPHTMTCGHLTGMCDKIDWANLPAAFITCLRRLLPDKVVTRMHKLRDVNPTTSQLISDFLEQMSLEATDLTPEMEFDDQIILRPEHYLPNVKNLTELGCVGLKCERYRSNYTMVYDGWGNHQVVEVPLNVTGAVSDESSVCNYAARKFTDANSCVGTTAITNYGSSFCGLADGGPTDFRDLTSTADCLAPMRNTSSDCTAAGYTWKTTLDGYSFCVKAASATSASCLGTGTTPCSAHKTILDAAVAAKTFRLTDPAVAFDPSCATTMCYATTLSESQCLALRTTTTNGWSGSNAMIKVKAGISWDRFNNICQASLHHFPLYQQTSRLCVDMNGNFTLTAGNGLTTGTFLFHEGVIFRPSQWATENDCNSNGFCLIPQLNHMGTTQTDCLAAKACPHSCSKCVSTQYGRNPVIENVMCYDATALAENACRTPGRWLNYTTIAPSTGGPAPNNGICKLPYGERVGCEAANGTYVSCRDLTTEATCTAAGAASSTYASATSWIYKALDCKWDIHQPCMSADECAAEGRCLDDELLTCTCTPGTLCSCTTGVCIEEWHIDPTTLALNACLLGNPAIKKMSIGCANTTVATADDCTAKGSHFVWHTKAYTADACKAHGQGCYTTVSRDQLPGTPLLGRNASDCNLGGGGNVTDHYAWVVGTGTDPDTVNANGEVLGHTPVKNMAMAAEMFDRVRWRQPVWKSRLWAPANVVMPTMGHSAREQFGHSVLTSVISREIQRVVRKHISKFLPIFREVAIATCKTGVDQDCATSGYIDPITETYAHFSPRAMRMAAGPTVSAEAPTCKVDTACTAGLISGQTYPKLCQTCTLPLGSTRFPARTCTCLNANGWCNCAPGAPTVNSEGFVNACQCVYDDGTMATTNLADSPIVPFNPATFAAPRVQTMHLAHITAAVAATHPELLGVSGLLNIAQDRADTVHTTVGGSIFASAVGAAWNGQFGLAATMLGITISTLSNQDATPYAVVASKPGGGFIVGQLIGECGVTSGDDPSQYPQQLCLSVNPSIPRDPAFTTLDLTKRLVPLQTRVATTDSTSLCGWVYEPGTYCAAARIPDLNSVPNVSDATFGMILGIVLGVIALVLTGALVLMCTSKKPGYAPVLPAS